MGKTRTVPQGLPVGLEMSSGIVLPKGVSAQQLKAGVRAQQGAMDPGEAIQNRIAFLPLGVFRGALAFLDLDKLVAQPLVWAEQLHILGILDGREEDYDLQTLTLPLGSAVGTQLSGQITVPTGQVWYITAIEMVLPPDNIGSPTMNWRCSLWPDRGASPSPFGQAFHATDVNFSPGGGTQWDEFNWPGLIWAATNKQNPLRLPAGAKITFIATNTVGVAGGALTCIGRLYGFIGKPLVD